MPVLDHVVMPVRDAEATLKFYTEVLELPLLEAFSGDDWDGYPWLMMIFGLGGGQELVCVALQGAPAPDYRGVPVDARHYAFSAEGEADIDLWRSRLSQHAVEFWEERHGDRRSIYFADPDGVVLEVTWPPTKVYGIEIPGLVQEALQWIRKAKQPA